LEIGRFLRLSQFLKSECPNRQFIFRVAPKPNFF